MASVFSVLAKIQADTSNFTAGMDKAQNSVEKLTKEQKKFDKQVSDTEKGVKNLGGGFGKLKGVIAAAGAAFAATGLTQVVMGTINAASDLEESITAIDATFGEASTKLKEFAENANTQVGQSRTQFLTAAKTFGIFGNAAGLANEANVEFSNELVQLASDLASFNNTTVDDAITALAAGLRGESEPLRRYGVLLSEAENQQMAMKMGIFDGTGALSQQQRVLAAHASILEQTKIQQGDFIRTSDGLANSQRILEATTKNLKEEVGNALLPAFTTLVQAVQPVIQALGPLLSDALKGLEPLITALQSAIDPLRSALEPLVSSLGTVASIVGKLADAFLPPLIKIIDKVARIADKLFIALEPIVDSLLPVLGEVIEKMVLPLFDFLAKIIEGVVIPAIEAFGGFLEKYLVPHLYGLVEVFETYVLPILEEWGSWIDTHLPAIQGTFERVFDAIGKAVTWFRDHVIGPLLGGLADFLGLDFSGFETAFVRGVEKASKAARKVGNPYAEPDYLRVIEEQSEAAGAMAADSLVTGITNTLNKTGTQTEVRNAYREMLAVFDDEIKKQNAKLKLEGLGLSEGLISYILGDADWEQIFNVIVKYGKRAVDKVQALYDQTAEGLAEVNAKIEEYNAKLKAFTEAADGYKKAMQNAFDEFIPLATIERNLGRFEQQIEQTIDQFTAFAEQGFASGVLDESFRDTMNNLLATHKSAMTEIARQRDELDSKLADAQMLKNYTNQFAEGIGSLLESAQPLSRFSEQIGEFESAVVASFDNISANVEQGIKVGIFVDETADALRTAVKNTGKTLRTIGRQRDELAKQYDEYVRQLDSATAFRQATKEASLGYADITNIGRSARVMTKNLSVIVARTKTFQQELSTLAAMGLNRELYREIVTSGLDAGSATAKAILRGGDSAVLELNNLFEELQSVSDGLAEDSTKILYDGGVEQIQGLIDGVLSQDEELRASAEAIANSFTSQFQTSFDVATANIDSLIESIKGQQSELEQVAIQLANAFKTAFQQTVGDAVTVAQGKIEADKPKVDNSAEIAVLDTKIANAQRYIKNINNDVFEAGALKKLQGYIEQRQRLVDEMQGYALGGLVSGAGTSTSDSVVARLSAGEYVMRADAVNKYGSGFMSAINSGTLPKFAKGGPVGQVRGSGKVVVQNNFQINVKAGIGDPAAIGKQVVSAIAAYEKTSGKQIL